jgi:4-hydroxy-3-methylbut-2-enyl diphosphate reductase
MALRALDRALELFGAPLFAYHQIVHNSSLVDCYRKRGVRFVDNLREVPVGAAVVFSAHGVSPMVRREATDRHLRVIDATCPLVHKVHAEARRFIREGCTVILVGHRGHDETDGIAGEVGGGIKIIETSGEAESVEVPADKPVAYLTQTTLSTEETQAIIAVLHRRFPTIHAPVKEDICYATKNRQEAVRVLAARANLAIVVGSENSSNSRRLAETAEGCGVPAHLVGGVDDLDPEWFTPETTVLITSGASTPEGLVQALISRLRSDFGGEATEVGVAEEAQWFQLPVVFRRIGPGRTADQLPGHAVLSSSTKT